VFQVARSAGQRVKTGALVLAAALALPWAERHGQAAGPSAPAVPPAVNACIPCHGERGEGNAAAGNPRIAGQSRHYIARQLESYLNGSRRDPVMEPIAKGLPREVREAIAAYYAQIDTDTV